MVVTHTASGGAMEADIRIIVAAFTGLVALGGRLSTGRSRPENRGRTRWLHALSTRSLKSAAPAGTTSHATSAGAIAIRADASQWAATIRTDRGALRE
jgi:hypothetical protein